MAKVNGPFCSFSASGSIFKTLTASTWKGLKIIRGWVKPAFPNTPPQQAVNAILAAANVAWHAVTWTVADLRAWVVYASTRSTPQTGQNQYIREAVRILAIPKTIQILFDGQSSQEPGTDVTLWAVGDGALPKVKFVWGYQPNVLLYGNTNMGHVGGRWRFQITPGTLPPGTTIYWSVYEGDVRADTEAPTGVYRWVQI